MRHAVRLVLLLLASGSLCLVAAQTNNAASPADNTAPQTNTAADSSGWKTPVIKGYGEAFPLPDAAVQPQKDRTYKVVFNVTKAGDTPTDVLPGLEHAARLLNLYGTLGITPKNLKIVAIITGPASWGAMNDDVYREHYKKENPNIKLIQELKDRGVEIYLCGQALHGLKLEETQMAPGVKMATSALLVLMVYESDGYVLMPF